MAAAAPCPVSGHHWEGSGTIPWKYLWGLMGSPLSLPISGTNRPSSSQKGNKMPQIIPEIQECNPIPPRQEPPHLVPIPIPTNCPPKGDRGTKIAPQRDEMTPLRVSLECHEVPPTAERLPGIFQAAGRGAGPAAGMWDWGSHRMEPARPENLS